MASFNGPWSTDIDSLKKSTESMPEQYKGSFASASKATLEKICDSNTLHVWESDSDIDNLLQLTSVIAKMCDLGVRKEKGHNARDGAMLIIAEETSGRNNFTRLCQLVNYLTEANGESHLDRTVCVFGKIVVVRGWDNSITSGQKKALEKTCNRVNTALERVLQMHSGKREVVWHHGAVIPFLLHWINTTTNALRSCLSAITIAGALDLTSSIAPSITGRANKTTDLERLGVYAKRLDIPVVFLDSSSQLINSGLNTYMYYHAYYIHTFLPSSLRKPHLHKALDSLITFAFRLRGASESHYGAATVTQVKTHLDASKARAWARTCVAKESYSKEQCRSAGRSAAIHAAAQWADAPFAHLNTSNHASAFARLAVGPAASSDQQSCVAVPVHIAFAAGRMRPSYPARLHVLVPSPGQDVETVTNRIQGLMMAVLERVRREKGNPVLGEEDKALWKAVVQSCTWALDGCEGKMPKGVGEKVKFVKDNLTKGTWEFSLGSAAGAGKSAGADGVGQTVSGPNRTYGFGLGAQQMGMYGHGGAQHQGVMLPGQGGGYGQYVPTQGQAPGMHMDPAMYAQRQPQGHVQAMHSPGGYRPQW